MKKSSEGDNKFDGMKFIDVILIVIFISLFIFGSTDIKTLTNAPTS